MRIRLNSEQIESFSDGLCKHGMEARLKLLRIHGKPIGNRAFPRAFMKGFVEGNSEQQCRG